MEADHGNLPATVESLTGGGGRHLFFAHPGGSIGNRAGVKPGLDVRGDGGYVVAPESNHVSGERYRWAESLAPGQASASPLPDWLMGLIAQKTRAQERKNYRETERQRTDCVGISVTLPGVSADVLDLMSHAVWVSLPQRSGVRNHCVFDLCRRLRAIPEVAGMPPAGLRPAVEKWFELARDVIETKEFAATWTEFLYGWPRVKWPHGMTWEAKMQEAKTVDEKAVPEAVRCMGTEAVVLARLCIALAGGSDGAVFFMGCRDAGRCIGVSHETAHRMLGAFVTTGFLEVVKRGNERRATRYALAGKDDEGSR